MSNNIIETMKQKPKPKDEGTMIRVSKDTREKLKQYFEEFGDSFDSVIRRKFGMDKHK